MDALKLANAMLFLSTLSLRRATAIRKCQIIPIIQFLSTLSLRRATASGTLSDTSDVISIHALLAESDGILPHDSRKIIKFLSTLSLRRATRETLLFACPFLFLSTLSLRRATIPLLPLFLQTFHFYPRSPCGERRFQSFCKSGEHYFYPRSPCGERP